MAAYRFYFQEDMPERGVGGKEIHRLRREVFLVRKGELELELEDVYRNKEKFILEEKQGIIIPPFMLHTLRINENNSILDIRANTELYFNLYIKIIFYKSCYKKWITFLTIIVSNSFNF